MHNIKVSKQKQIKNLAASSYGFWELQFYFWNRNLEKPESLKDLSGPRKMRLTSDLMAVIDIMMSVPEKATDMPIGSVLPWMILYSVIQW